jgi:hypothetical protein
MQHPEVFCLALYRRLEYQLTYPMHVLPAIPEDIMHAIDTLA